MESKNGRAQAHTEAQAHFKTAQRVKQSGFRLSFATSGVIPPTAFVLALAAVLFTSPMVTTETAAAATRRAKQTKSTAPTKSTKLVPPIKVAGAPVVVGRISQNGAGTQEALLAEQFLNANGGVSGRPLKIVTCATKGSDASARSCATQLMSKNIKVVLEGLPDGGWPAAAESFRAANVLVIGRSPLNAVEYNDSNALYLAPAAATVQAGTGVFLATVDHPRSVAVLVSSDPATSAGLPLALGPLRAAGILPIVTTLRKASADVAVVNAAILAATDAATAEGGAGAVVALVSEGQCLSVMEAVKALAFVGRLITTDACATAATIEATGQPAEGWVFVSANPSGEAQPQLAVFTDYAKAATKLKIRRSTESSAAINFASVVDAVSLLTKLEKSVLDASPGVVGATVKSYLGRAESTSTYAPKPYVYKRSKLFPSVAGFTVYATQWTGGRFIEAPGGSTLDAFLG
jgi:branched-chain amino acid transport system substrate-binding protein